MFGARGGSFRVSVMMCMSLDSHSLAAVVAGRPGAAECHIRKKNVRPDAPGARDALDAPWQGTYGSQRKTHRQCEFGRSLPGHHASGRSSPRHLLTGRSVARHFPSGRTLSGHFPSGRSRVRAFSFWTQPCQGKWHPDDACHGTVVTLAVKARKIAVNTRIAFTNTQRVPGIVTQSSSIFYI